MTKQTRIVFWGSDYYSTVALKVLLQSSQVNLCGVITTSSTPKLPFYYYEDIAQIASGQNLPILTVKKGADLHHIGPQLEKLQPDIGIVASFGLKIPQTIFTMPEFGTLNIHPSLLPEYRGVSPAQQVILDGIHQSGVTIIQINEDIDTGKIIGQETVRVFPSETSLILLQRLFTIGTKAFIEIIQHYPLGNFPTYLQNEQEATYTQKIESNKARIRWNGSPIKIWRQIKAFYPKPIAWTTLAEIVKQYSQRKTSPQWKQTRVKIYQAHLESEQVIPDLIQLEGKKIIPWNQFKRGYL